MVFSRCVKTIGLKCLSPLLTREPVQCNQDMELGILQNIHQLFSNTAGHCLAVEENKKMVFVVCAADWYGGHLVGRFAFYSLSPFIF